MRHANRYLDSMYRDGFKDMAVNAIQTLKKVAKFLGRNGLRLIKVLSRVSQVLVAVDMIASPAGLIKAKQVLEDGRKSLSILDALVSGKAIIEYGDRENGEFPSGLKMAAKIAIGVLTRAIGLGLAEIQIRLANKGIEALS